MRIVQIQPMRESWTSYTTRKSVAIALVGGFLSCLAGHGPTGAALAASSPGSLSGEARVIDGDTLDLGGQRVRLEGIDAPETGQTCAGGWLGTWDCGMAATKALRKLVDAHSVTCERRGTDKYGRMLGICFADGVDINQRMVRSGHAWAFVKYSSTYVAEEAAARAERLGVFAAENSPPWVYRTQQWASAEQQAPAGCAIKGNVTRNGSIYHMPWSPWYAKVVIDEGRGERWFCTESEAVAAGWRPAHGS